MRLTNEIFKKKLYNEIDSCIRNESTSFSKLYDHEQDYILSLLIGALGSDAPEYINDAININDMTSAFITYLDPTINHKSISEVMRENVIKYFTKHLDKLFDDRASEIDYENNIESGIIPSYHRDNGEMYWSKRT